MCPSFQPHTHNTHPRAHTQSQSNRKAKRGGGGGVVALPFFPRQTHHAQKQASNPVLRVPHGALVVIKAALEIDDGRRGTRRPLQLGILGLQVVLQVFELGLLKGEA